MTEVRCYVCGMAGTYYHDECWERLQTERLKQEGGMLLQRVGELLQKAEDVLRDIVAYDLPRGAQYRVRAAMLAKALEEMRDEIMALQAL